MASKPLTQRQLKERREAEETKTKQEFVIVHNCSQQLVIIQVVKQPKKGKKIDFYFAQQNVQLHPNQTVKLNKHEIMINQLKNLAAKNKIRILSGL